MSELAKALSAAKGRYVSGGRLAARLGLSRAAIHKQVEKLRRQGYAVTGTNRLGYRLERTPDLLVAGAVAGWPQGRAACLAVTESTQEEAKKHALAGAPEGTLVAAETQTAGRGRMGRRWISPAGGLWYSLLLRPAVAPGQVPALVLVAAMDWARVIRRRAGLDARVKWPNDVWVGGRKVAGILTEMSSEMDRVHWAVLGVGVNVNNPPPKTTGGVPAGSLAELAGRPLARQALLNDWLKEFARSYRAYAKGGFAAFRKKFESLSVLKGRTALCRTAEGVRRGKVLGVDELGRLRLKTDGNIALISEGEVRPGR